jgi:hypothetical protein
VVGKQVVHDLGVVPQAGMVGQRETNGVAQHVVERVDVSPGDGVGQCLRARHRDDSVVRAETLGEVQRPHRVEVTGDAHERRLAIAHIGPVVVRHRGRHHLREPERVHDELAEIACHVVPEWGEAVRDEAARVRCAQRDQRFHVVVRPHVLARVDPTAAVREDVHPFHTEAPLEVVDGRGDLGAVVGDRAPRGEVRGVAGHVPALEPVEPGGAGGHLDTARAEAVDQEHRPPGQPRRVHRLQHQPVHLHDSREVDPRDGEGELVRHRLDLLTARAARALFRTGIGREPHIGRLDLQHELLPVLAPRAVPALERAERPLARGPSVEDDLDGEQLTQDAADLDGRDPAADGEQQALGQRALVQMQPRIDEEPLTVDRADVPGGVDGHRDDLPGAVEWMLDVQYAGSFVGDEPALGELLRWHTGVADTDGVLRRDLTGTNGGSHPSLLSHRRGHAGGDG